MYKKRFYQNIVASHHTEMMNLATLRQAVDLCSGGTVTIERLNERQKRARMSSSDAP